MREGIRKWYGTAYVRVRYIAMAKSSQLEHFKELDVIGGKDCEAVSKTPGHNTQFKIGDISVQALHTPCHTQDSICYYMKDGDQKAVFTGDTLFIGGCGRFFEGTAAEMHTALNEKLAGLPDDTNVYVSAQRYPCSVIQYPDFRATARSRVYKKQCQIPQEDITRQRSGAEAAQLRRE